MCAGTFYTESGLIVWKTWFNKLHIHTNRPPRRNCVSIKNLEKMERSEVGTDQAQNLIRTDLCGRRNHFFRTGRGRSACSHIPQNSLCCKEMGRRRTINVMRCRHSAKPELVPPCCARLLPPKCFLAFPRSVSTCVWALQASAGKTEK